ncbi:hypothetical protein B0H17DRAFT_1125734 [Mycena rosella]|uniref:F-box domain-containing protein n=1 Tax=Mycena rosella TaxID=1033263 RepID=A0AAD7GWV8_MYCRO|nr:hypothetical protein B0H17DRAFT_1125734 [Mycena rosella]
MPSFALGAGLVLCSNREPQYQNQNTLVIDKDGRIRYAAISRRVLALPPEILAEIFLHCLPAEEFVSPDITSAPILLCGICRHFREIALSTPRLWSSLRCDSDVFDMAQGTETKLIELIRSWLSRARRTPLSLSLCLYDPEGMWESDSAGAILQIAVDLSPQWRNIDMELAPILSEVLFPLDGNFPLLEKLAIDGIERFPSWSFRDAAKLRHFSSSVYYPAPHSSMQLLPWHQITTVCIGELEFSIWLAILRDATTIVDGTFGVQSDDSPAQPIFVPPLNHLQSLTIVGFAFSASPTVPMEVLDSLTAPALKSLTLDFPHDFTTALDTSPFLRFATRSTFQLHSLVLSFMATPPGIIQCLKAVPSLVLLKIQLMGGVIDVNPIFRRLTESDFLPKLESLHMIFDPLVSLTEHDRQALALSLVFQVLCWRWAGVGITRLRSFQLAHAFNAPSLDRTMNSNLEFRRLAAEGMDLYVGPLRPVIDWINHDDS